MPSRYTSTGRVVALGAPSILAQIAALAPAGTYWWHGEDATLAAWADRLQGVNAAPSGSGTTIGTLGGRACPVFNGSGWYLSASNIIIAQPYTILSVSQRANVLASRCIWASAGGNCALWHDGGADVAVLTAGTPTTSVPTLGGDPLITRSVLDGASTTLYKNETSILAANVGTAALSSTFYIGSLVGVARPFVGPIADVLVMPGADGAQIARLLGSYYGITVA